MKVRDYKGDLVQSPKDKQKIVASFGNAYIVWSRNKSIHQVRYGLQTKTFISEIDAAQEFGECVYHYVKCEGLLD